MSDFTYGGPQYAYTRYRLAPVSDPWRCDDGYFSVLSLWKMVKI